MPTTPAPAPSLRERFFAAILAKDLAALEAALADGADPIEPWPASSRFEFQIGGLFFSVQHKQPPIGAAVAVDNAAAIDILRRETSKLGAGASATLAEQAVQALFEATLDGLAGCAEALLRIEGVDVDATDRAGNTPFLLATLKNRVDIMRMLLEKGAAPWALASDNGDSFDAMEAAFYNQAFDATRFLVRLPEGQERFDEMVGAMAGLDARSFVWSSVQSSFGALADLVPAETARAVHQTLGDRSPEGLRARVEAADLRDALPDASGAPGSEIEAKGARPARSSVRPRSL
jgi:hypothetical protein